jgi:uncharacterized ferredoxin-like protein
MSRCYTSSRPFVSFRCAVELLYIGRGSSAVAKYYDCLKKILAIEARNLYEIKMARGSRGMLSAVVVHTVVIFNFLR